MCENEQVGSFRWGDDMNEYTVVKLINNVALIMSLSVFNNVGHLLFKVRGRIAQIFDGVTIGAVGIALMLVPLEITQNLVIDTRSILFSVTALVFGFAPTFIAASMTILYRFSMGGVGMGTEILIILSVSLFGLYWRNYIVSTIKNYRVASLYVFGVITHVLMLLCFFTLPFEAAVDSIRSMAMEILLIFPLGTLLLGTLLIAQNEQQEIRIKAAEADTQFRNLFENNHASMLIVDPKTGKIKDANLAAVNFYGWSRDTLLAMNINQINTMSAEEFKVELDKKARLKRNYFEFKHRKADGSYADVEEYTGPLQKYGNRLLYSIIHDVTDQVQARRQLEASEDRFRSLVERAPYAIFIETERRFVYLNDLANQLFGTKNAEELIGAPLKDRFHPDYNEAIHGWFMDLTEDHEMAPPADMVFLKMNNTPVDVNAVAVPIDFEGKKGTLVFAMDTTQLRGLERLKKDWEAQMRQQQKLEAIGTLAGGVAHEINNPLNGILNYAQLILDQIDAASDSATFAQEIVNETERISGIVRNLLQFSRMEKQSHSLASIYDIVENTTSLIRTIIKKDNIVLDFQLDKDLPEFKCRSQQIQQVLMNLLTNARDALNEQYPSHDERKRIELRCHKLTQDNKNWLIMSVTDYGCGIPDSVKNRIFEPFFSTKPKDKGTGLGLSISYGIVKDHKGEILVETVENQYTTFSVKLPIDNDWENTEGIYE
ncbi:MAG: PAS domain S-box protein [Erysipelotrichales bacterium]|nr:MAG: PAS domain S-box protein [Erysipelotrichales bacterium]